MSLERDFAPSGLVVLRTPLLPFEEIEAWSADLHAHSANGDDEVFARDRVLLRERLATLLERPEIAEALFVASPALVESLGYWRRDPDSKKGQRAEQGLVRYFLRMASRPTPFGLLAGCTSGSVGERTRLAIAERRTYRRHSRLDNDYLLALCEHVTRDPGLRREMRFHPNSSLYEVGGRVRYAEARMAGRMRTYHLVAVDSFDALRMMLECASGGATLEQLATALIERNPDDEISREDAEAFIHELIENQILVPELDLPVTGEDSTHGVLRQLSALQDAGDAADRLARVERLLADLDAKGLGGVPEAYDRIARELEPLGVPVEIARLFHIDLFKPAREVVLGEPVIAEILRGVEILHRMVTQLRHEPLLAEFRRAFRERYGEAREVPLLAALDEESGIGFERSGLAAAEASPLLAGLPLTRRGDNATILWNPIDAALIRLLTRGLEEGRIEVELTDDDLKRLENRERPPLPDAFHAFAMLAADSPDALERGDFRLFLHNATGPSGARMLGRFCHADESMCRSVRTHLAAEERHHPDALFAEIVHLPAGRVGNVLARPLLRHYEIPFLGRSGAPADHQIRVDDLMVTVIGERIRLRSKSRDREVIPRLTTAHNTTGESLGVYRFLAAMQQAVGMEWSWGPLEAAPFLPRVVSGRLVLARARWRLFKTDIEPLASASGAARFRLAQEWRAAHRMPRFVALMESDHELLIDFRNPLNVDAVMELFRNREEVVVVEVYPAPHELCVAGVEGRFAHELIVPFNRRVSEQPRVPAARAVVAAAARATRSFPPGSEWLYAKLYAGTGSVDQILRDELAPLAQEVLANDDADRWFFIRYGDPSWHLRLRFHGEPARLRAAVLPRLELLFQRLLEKGTAWKFQLDTYEREVERYGGDEGIELSEALFFHDSVAVLTMLDSVAGDAGADLRWHLMLAGMDRLLDDFGLDPGSKLDLAAQARDGHARQFRYEPLRARIAERLRRDRSALDRLLFESNAAPELAPLEQRSRAIAGIIQELRTRERHGRLQTPVTAIVPNYVHMFVNRLSRSAGPEHELVLYDYLVQLYRSRLARAAKPRLVENRLVATT